MTVDEMFTMLEEKLNKLVALVAELKAENGRLRQDNEALKGQSEEAVKRINFMVDKLSGVV